jgi:hypothetical protein
LPFDSFSIDDAEETDNHDFTQQYLDLELFDNSNMFNQKQDFFTMEYLIDSKLYRNENTFNNDNDSFFQ